MGTVLLRDAMQSTAKKSGGNTTNESKLSTCTIAMHVLPFLYCDV